VIILSGALVYALYIPLLSALQRGRDALDVSRAIAVGGTVLFATWSLSSGTLFEIPDMVAFGASLLQGLLSAGSFLGFLAGLKVLGNVRTAITSTVEPFWTTMLGVVLLGQGVGTGTIIGGIAIMGAVLLLQRPVASARVRSSDDGQ
jgi:drug/metabolite transporter (DMT)-like permease